MNYPIKLFLDDERPGPDGWVVAKTSRDAILMLMTGQVTQVSLDHDLGPEEAGNGYDVLHWLERQVAECRFEPPKIAVHTANSAARPRMLAAVASIERLVAARRQDDGTPAELRAHRMAAIPPGVLDWLLSEPKAVYGDNLEQVILYGSYAYGVPRPVSDIDVCLILSRRVDNPWEKETALSANERDAGIELNYYTVTRADIERYRSYPLCMQYRILTRGIALFDSGQRAPSEPALAEVIRDEIALRWLRIAYRKIKVCDDDWEVGVLSVHMRYLFDSACFALKAMLLSQNVDASHWSLRWDLASLQRLAALFVPGAAGLSENSARLPGYFDTCSSPIGGKAAASVKFSATELDGAIAAAKEIYVFCAEAIGIDAAQLELRPESEK